MFESPRVLGTKEVKTSGVSQTVSRNLWYSEVLTNNIFFNSTGDRTVRSQPGKNDLGDTWFS